MEKETIILDHLSIGYNGGKRGQTIIAHDICASLHAGELTCLLGSNGIGKSTLLKTLSGFLPSISGRFLVNGRDFSQYTNQELAKEMGVVLTTKIDIQNMSAREVIGLGRSPYTGFWGTLNEEDKRIVDEAIQTTGIGTLADRMIQTLSDGERQKVMIAKALAQQTPVIFLDEPTAFLDFTSKVDMLRLLKRLARENDKTIFLSTHDVDLALQITDKVWLMDHEHGVTIGTPRQLADDGLLGQFLEGEGVDFDKDSFAIHISE